MWSIESIKTANHNRGRYFFSPGAMRFFASRVSSFVAEGPGGVYFVTSEQFRPSSGPAADRLYTVRRFFPETGEVEEASEFQAFRSLSGAKACAERMAKASQ